MVTVFSNTPRSGIGAAFAVGLDDGTLRYSTSLGPIEAVAGVGGGEFLIGLRVMGRFPQCIAGEMERCTIVGGAAGTMSCGTEIFASLNYGTTRRPCRSFDWNREGASSLAKHCRAITHRGPSSMTTESASFAALGPCSPGRTSLSRANPPARIRRWLVRDRGCEACGMPLCRPDSPPVECRPVCMWATSRICCALTRDGHRGKSATAARVPTASRPREMITPITEITSGAGRTDVGRGQEPNGYESFRWSGY